MSNVNDVLAIARAMFGEKATVGYADNLLGWIRPSSAGDFWVGMNDTSDVPTVLGRGYSWLDALSMAATTKDHPNGK